MLEPDQWDAVLSRVSGTVYRGTERISSNALLNLSEVGPDPVLRQKMRKRTYRIRDHVEAFGRGEGIPRFCAPRLHCTARARRSRRNGATVKMKIPPRGNFCPHFRGR